MGEPPNKPDEAAAERRAVIPACDPAEAVLLDLLESLKEGLREDAGLNAFDRAAMRWQIEALENALDQVRAIPPRPTPDAEVEALRADKARLDFLDRLNSGLNAHYGTNYRWRLITNHNVNRLFFGHAQGGYFPVDLQDAQPRGLPSCREAIDERMREVGAAPAVAPATPTDLEAGLMAARAFIAAERASFIDSHTTGPAGGDRDLSTLDEDARAMLADDYDPALAGVEAAIRWLGAQRRESDSLVRRLRIAQEVAEGIMPAHATLFSDAASALEALGRHAERPRPAVHLVVVGEVRADD